MKNKLESAIYGFAIGDALGVPFEFRKRNTFKCKTMEGYGTWGQPAGTWSDDTSMILATMDAFGKGNIVNLNQIMKNFSDWYNKGKYTPYGECFDIGGTTRIAVNRYDNGMDPRDCGGTDEYSNGNGALMRILPLAFFDYDENLIDTIAGLTHNTARSKFACEMYIKVAQNIIMDKFDPNDPYMLMIKNLPREKVKSTGYVIDTLIACLWSFLNSDNYVSAVFNAVNLGNDTDTIAALTGALAGLKYGYDYIPIIWIEQLANKDLIDKIVHKFLKSQDKST